MPFLNRPQSRWYRRAFFQTHVWVGVIAGLYISLVCTTGAALMFRIDMQRASYPELFTPSRNGPLAEPADILESIRTAYPQHRVSGIDAPTTSRPTYLAYAVRNDQFATILLDPVTARVLGELPDTGFVRSLQSLHFDLLAGSTGRFVNGIGALCLLTMCLTGVVIWWPGMQSWRRSLRVDFSRSWKRVTWDLHSATGFWCVAFIAMWATTGLYFTFPGPFRNTVRALSSLTRAQSPTSHRPAATDAPRAAWPDLIARARARVPGQHVARVVVPSTDSGAFLVMFSTRVPTPADGARLTSVYLDQYSGAVLQEPPRTPPTLGDIVMDWMAPLHVGNFGGTLVKLIWLVIGLTPPLLFVTGFVMWWSRLRLLPSEIEPASIR